MSGRIDPHKKVSQKSAIVSIRDARKKEEKWAKKRSCSEKRPSAEGGGAFSENRKWVYGLRGDIFSILRSS